MNHLIDDIRRRGLLTSDAADRAAALVAEGRSLEDAILAADGVGEEQLLRVLAETFEVPYVDLENVAPAREFLAKFPTRLLVRHKVLPVEERPDGVVVIACSRISDTTALDQIRLVTGRELRTLIESDGADPKDIAARREAYRAARAKADAELKTAREELKGLVTQRQEAVLVMAGLLE